MSLPEGLEFTGVVIAGEGRGRSIGFPTANLQITPVPDELPRGVFAGLVRFDGEALTAVVNIGCRPTFSGDGGMSVEVHILDFDANLYGKSLAVRLGQRLRDEKRFDSAKQLTEQIERDIKNARP